MSYFQSSLANLPSEHTPSRCRSSYDPQTLPEFLLYFYEKAAPKYILPP